MTKRYIKLDSIKAGYRTIIPIAHLDVLSSNNIFYFIDYDVVAFIIKEDDEIYYKNISLSENEFHNLKKKIEKIK